MFQPSELDDFYRYCVALTRDREEAFDLLQNALEKWVKQDFVPKDKRNYFLKMIRNQYIDDYRKQSRQSEVVQFDEEAVQALQPERELDELLIQRERLEEVMEKLSSADREILYLWAVEEHSASEIAQFLESSRGTVLSRMSRLRAKIQKLQEQSESETGFES